MDFYEANSEEWEARLKSNIMVTPAPDVETPYDESARVEPYFWGPISVKLDRHERPLRHREQQAPHTDLREAVRQREEHNHERGRTTYPSVRRQTVLPAYDSANVQKGYTNRDAQEVADFLVPRLASGMECARLRVRSRPNHGRTGRGSLNQGGWSA